MGDGEDGRWITHDGSPCPCRGKKVEVEQQNGTRTIIIAGSTSVNLNGVVKFARSTSGKPTVWEWAGPRAAEIPVPLRVVRYRFIKPDALLELERIARLEPEPV